MICRNLKSGGERKFVVFFFLKKKEERKEENRGTLYNGGQRNITNKKFLNCIYIRGSK